MNREDFVSFCAIKPILQRLVWVLTAGFHLERKQIISFRSQDTSAETSLLTNYPSNTLEKPKIIQKPE